MTPAQLMQLRDRILGGPLAAECAPLVKAGQHRLIADALNDRRFTARHRIPIAEFIQALQDRGRLTGILFVGKLGNPVAQAAVGLVTTARALSLEKIDLDEPEVRAELAALVEQKLISDDDRTALIALGDVARSDADLAGLGAVTHSDVADALRG